MNVNDIGHIFGCNNRRAAAVYDPQTKGEDCSLYVSVPFLNKRFFTPLRVPVINGMAGDAPAGRQPSRTEADLLLRVDNLAAVVCFGC
jgi:hypothetical protein